MKRMVMSLDKNALGKTPDEQIKVLNSVAETIANIISEGYEIAITCESAGEIGRIHESFKENDYASLPFSECEAMSQGYIGYQLQQAIRNELNIRHIDKNCISLITQVVVDKDDKEFYEPSKPIGKFCNERESKKVNKKTGYVFKEDLKKGFRRVIPSPKPISIVEIDMIRDLYDTGTIVIVSGGGVPVVKYRNTYRGVNAIVDKDRTSALLAKELDADVLLALSTFEKVSLRYNSLDQVNLSELDINDAKKYIEAGEFSKNNLLTKVESCVDFCDAKLGNIGIMTSLDCAYEAVIGETGTIIKNVNDESELRHRRFAATFEGIVVLLLDILLIIAICTYCLL